MPAAFRSAAHSWITAVAEPSWKRPPMVGSPRPTMRTSPSSVPVASTCPRTYTPVVTWKDGLRRSMAAAVVKSFMFDAGATGMCGLRSATTRPVWSSTIWMLDAAPLATPPFTSDASRSSNVRPTGTAGGFGAAALRVGAAFFFEVVFFFFFDWASDRGVSRRIRTARIAPGRVARSDIGAKDSAKVVLHDPLPRLRQRETDSLVQRSGQSSADAVADLVARVAPRKVREHDQVVAEPVGKVCKVVDVDVPVRRRALLVPLLDERALDHQHLGLKS